MKIGSLFSGYQGLDMAVEAVTGAHTVWVSDIDKGACKILAHRAPDIPNLGDITAIDWSAIEPVDILTGGFPCQDLSHAGKRAGLREGTRSGLWSHMARAIDELRPRLVVAENVRGLLSAEAPGEVEPCPWCVGDGSTVDLRALGVVLADLAGLGYDAQWVGLRAADLGACHGRFRIFLVAHPQGDPWRFGYGDGGRVADAEGDGWDQGRAEPARLVGRPNAAERGTNNVATLLPSPSASDTNGPGSHGGGGLDLRTAINLLPTPVTEPATGNGHARNLSKEARLLPTPAVNDMGAGKSVEAWDEWTDAMKAKHGNGNGHGPSLAIEAQRLLPTPTRRDHKDNVVRREPHRPEDTDTLSRALADCQTDDVGDNYGHTPEVGPDEVLRDVRGTDGAQAVREAVGGPDEVLVAPELLTGVRQHEGRSDEGRTPLAGAEASGRELPRLRGDGESARPSHRQEPSEQRPEQLGDALRELPSETSLARGPRRTCGCHAWGHYAPAVHRWEVVLGRPAPAPTEPTGKGGSHRLSARAVEWMMGLPEGWVTDVPGLTRNEALKALGNGVVPLQAEAALRHMLAMAVAA